MTAAAMTVPRAVAVLLVAFLSLRGVIGLWQQFVSADAPPGTLASVRSNAAVDEPHRRALALPTPATPPAPPIAAAPPPRADDHRPDPAAPVPWQAIERSASFVEGHAGPVVAAFIDLDCGYCTQLWRRVRAPLAAGRLRVRWIPVGVLSRDSARRAATLLRSADPGAALAAHASRKAAPIPAAHEVSFAAAGSNIDDDVAANNALLAALSDGRPATPLLAARGGDHRPRVLIGPAANLGSFIADAR